MADATIAARPAAGPETLSEEPLNNPTTTPPITPAIIPANGAASDAIAIPMHSGRATRNTTMEAGISAPGWIRFTGIRLSRGEDRWLQTSINNSLTLLREPWETTPFRVHEPCAQYRQRNPLLKFQCCIEQWQHLRRNAHLPNESLYLILSP